MQVRTVFERLYETFMKPFLSPTVTASTSSSSATTTARKCTKEEIEAKKRQALETLERRKRMGGQKP